MGIRAATRFKADPLDYALVDLNPQSENTFAPQLSALILNESYTGSALVLVTDQPLRSEQVIKVKIGKLDPMSAKLVWFKALDKDLFKVGVQYLE